MEKLMEFLKQQGVAYELVKTNGEISSIASPSVDECSWCASVKQDGMLEIMGDPFEKTELCSEEEAIALIEAEITRKRKRKTVLKMTYNGEFRIIEECGKEFPYRLTFKRDKKTRQKTIAATKTLDECVQRLAITYSWYPIQ